MGQTSEQLLIAEILHGQTEQYRLLVERYHRGLINYLTNLLHDQDQAEDVAQEAFLQAYLKLAQYKPKYAFSTWLYRIAANQAYRVIKKDTKTTLLHDPEMLTDPRVSVAESLDKQHAQKQVHSAVQNLEPNYQQVVVLYYWDNKSYEEIASILDRPIGTIRTWLHRAKDDLRKELYGQI